MTREEFEQHRRWLDEQLRVGVELLQAAHATQVRALQLLWASASGGAAAPGSPPSDPGARNAAPPQKTPRRHAYELEGEVRTALARCPEVFDPRDLCSALGYEPHRASLHRVLEKLVLAREIALHERGEGRRPSKYRRLVSGPPDAEPPPLAGVSS